MTLRLTAHPPLNLIGQCKGKTMAYMSQEKKAKIVAAVKPILKKYGIKGTFAVQIGRAHV